MSQTPRDLNPYYNHGKIYINPYICIHLIMNMHGDGPTVEKWKHDNDQTDTLLGEETHAVE